MTPSSRSTPCGPSEVPELRAILLADSPGPADTDGHAAPTGPGAGALAAVVAALQPAELHRAGDDRRRRRGDLPDGSRCGTGGFASRQAGARRRRAARRRRDGRRGRARRAGARVLLSVARSLRHVRQPGAVPSTTATRGVLHLQHGLLRVREHTYDMRRLRGGTLREPLLVRAFGGARLDAVMTGVDGAGEASLLLPPCPARHGRGGADGADRTARRGQRRVARPRPCRDAQALDAGADAARAAGRRPGGAGVRRPGAAVGVAALRCGGRRAARSWRRTGPARSVTGSATAGWSRGRAASTGAATASPPRASSAGPCARRCFSAAPGWRR